MLTLGDTAVTKLLFAPRGGDVDFRRWTKEDGTRICPLTVESRSAYGSRTRRSASIKIDDFEEQTLASCRTVARLVGDRQ